MIAVLYIAGVFFAGTLPQGPELPEELEIPQSDKLLHAIVFGGMTVLVWRVLRNIFAKPSRAQKEWAGARNWIGARKWRAAPKWIGAPKWIAAIAIASALGALLEVAQTAVPTRSADIWDWAADTLGALIACAVTALVLGRLSAQASGHNADPVAR